ncbi:MAG: outer membrane lipoprotein LolB [Gammaproteobacteria bacterium]|nr:outer membrane lipoprotein LolB [Pseudomonadota bacterium]TDJ10307.1 MAG: outer membrane lipoprotein LolB [Gammaproteobacteria bacterium]
MRPDSTARYIAIALSLLAIAGCATQRGVDLPELSDWETRTRILAGMADWEFRGRIGVSAGNEGFNGKLRYAQNDNDFRLVVSGPLGFGSIRIEGDSQRVTVTDKDGEETVLQDPEFDLRAMYGWTIPVTSLRYWALGIPDPAVPADTEFNEDGQLASLRQGSWLIEIAQYRDGGGQSMPRRLTAVSGDNKVRLLIDNWTFRQPN